MVEFESEEKLFERVYPCLKLKQKLLSIQGYDINIKDIWEYLANNLWKSSNNLTLYDIVNDIMILDVNNLKEV